MHIITKDGNLISGKQPGLVGNEIVACLLTKEDDNEKVYDMLKHIFFTHCSEINRQLFHEILQDVLHKYRRHLHLTNDQS